MPKEPSRTQRVGIVYNTEKERAYPECLRLKRWLQKRKITVVAAPRASASMRTAQLVVALGGDGTVLEVARAMAPWGVPVLGVNLGRLGFLAATEVQAMFPTLSRVLGGHGRLETRTTLAVTGKVRGKKLSRRLALNDCVLRSGATGRVLTLHARVRNLPLATYVGDGLIVATPTGSTAYNLAASGPIVYPDLDAFILTPLCPHSLSQRPLLLPTDEIIAIEVGRPSPAPLLCVDGIVMETLSPGDSIEVRRAPEQALLLMDPQRTYYQVLQTKLKWGGG